MAEIWEASGLEWWWRTLIGWALRNFDRHWQRSHGDLRMHLVESNESICANQHATIKFSSTYEDFLLLWTIHITFLCVGLFWGRSWCRSWTSVYAM
jgi:hypothetical protein